MASVRLQNKDIEALQDYIDAQNGGPGRGWFRIVTNPFQARRVIARGKLAVIKGIEVSEPFGCRVYNDDPKCDRAQIDREIDRRPAHGRAPDGADQQVRQRARRRGRRQRLDRRRGERRQPARHRQVLADAALHGPARGARQAAARRVRPRRERHPQPRDRAVPAARGGAGLPERLELQRARPHGSRRSRRPEADAGPDHHRPGPPQREGAQEHDGPDRGGALLRRRVEPQLEHRGRDPADLQGRRRRRPR